MKTYRALFVLPFLLCGCVWGTNTTTPQNTTSINESKEIEHFICEYSCTQQPKEMFSFNEIWAEHGWYNDIKDNKVVRTRSHFIHICFTLKNTKSMLKPDEYLDRWSARDTNAPTSLGLKGYGKMRMYTLSYPGDTAPKKIELVVYKLKDSAGYQRKTPTGTLTLIKK